MFENKLTHNGIHYSRYIVSWINGGGKISTCGRNPLFREFLRDVENLTEDEIRDIIELATNGKMELERNVAWFFSKKYKVNHDDRSVACV